MAVPKKRTGSSAQGHRRSHWKATVPTLTECKNCNEKKLAHTVCESCGYYGDKPASKKNLEE
jgi:large subunit ribosomal protein L32